MKIRTEVEMLAVVVVLCLALGVSDGVVVNKCQLGNELKTSLPASLLNKIPNLVAKIVCHVGMSSNFNTSSVTYVSGPEKNNLDHEEHGGRKGRSAESNQEESSEESSEDSSEESSDVPQPTFGSMTIHPSTDTQAIEGRRRRSAQDEDSSEKHHQMTNQGFNSSTVNPATHAQDNNHLKRKAARSGRSAEFSSEESIEKHPQTSNNGFSSSTVPPSTHAQDNNTLNGKGKAARRSRSAESSSEESIEKHHQTSNNGFSSSTVPPATHAQGNNTLNGKRSVRIGRSAESNSKETNERTTWTLYGLFQLPDRIACISGNESSLNLCNTTCNSLTDNDISNDIACVETILHQILAKETLPESSKVLLNKLNKDFFPKVCSNALDRTYFTSC